MRTTVELKLEHRSALLALASRRGQKGFSSVLAEAIESYLRDEAGRRKRRETPRRLAGSLSEAEAEELRQGVWKVREECR